MDRKGKRVRCGTRIGMVAASCAVLLSLLAAGPVDAGAVERNPECNACHASLGQDWSVGAVDRDTACVKCHTYGLAGSHPYHNPGSNCGAVCHMPQGWGESASFAIPNVVGTRGSFAAAGSSDTDPAILHVIHASPRWPAGASSVVSKCASCHAAAACDACHTSGPSAGHAVHSATGNDDFTATPPAMNPQAPWTGTMAFGILGEDQSLDTALEVANECAASGCHDIDGTASRKPVTKEDFSHAAYPEYGYPEANVVVTSGIWRQARDIRCTAGSAAYSNHAGATIDFAIDAEYFELLTDTDRYRGQAEVLIDGVPAGVVDCYSPVTRQQQVVFRSPRLTPGAHTVRIRVLGTKSAASQGTWVFVDALRAFKTVKDSIAPKCADCHPDRTTAHGGTTASHPIHTDPDDPRGPGGLECSECHDTSAYPSFATGTDTNTNGRIELDETDVCDGCHSPGGAYDGVDSAGESVGARTNWATGVYETTATLQAGKEKWCVGCHDDSPASMRGASAPNTAGDGVTFGFYATGHGRETTFAVGSWQSLSEAGNPGANRACTDCHTPDASHIDSTTADPRLIPGMEDDADNSNCTSCHDPGTSATEAPVFYDTYAVYGDSAHSERMCSDCHDVHGASGAHPAMTTTDHEALCYQCHTDGMVQNDAVSGSALADSIEDAFGLAQQHDLSTTFTIDSKDYVLECVSCHNVHVVTGKYWEATDSVTPITRLTDVTEPWGDDPGEKMDDYVGSGTYQKPGGSTHVFDGDALPDYPTFCLDCHAYSIAGIGAKDWVGNPHGQRNAGYTGLNRQVCPNQAYCGRAWGWSDDEPSGTEEEAWPVIPKGNGYSAFVKGSYDNAERNAGVNFTMSCTDCHETHGSDRYSLMRWSVNSDQYGNDQPLSPTEGDWHLDDGFCWGCHGGYQMTQEHIKWHNTCPPCHVDPPQTRPDHVAIGYDQCRGSCHSSDYNLTHPNEYYTPATFHENRRTGSTGIDSTDSDPSLVLDMDFDDNTLNDDHMWNMHGLWINGSGAYVSGKVGSAIQVSDNPVEVGARNARWDSTNQGYTGNTSKLTEMKYHMTLEAWIYPTSDPADGLDRYVMTKHNYWSGGYSLQLRPVGGEYRAALITNMGYAGPTTSWDFDSYNCNGLRGAFSSVPVPLGEWTHVAATFDYEGPYGDPADLSVGKIRIYVNGVDVTTSDPLGSCWTQPQDPADPNVYDEEFMTPHADVRTKYPSRTGWLGTAFSVGGINWTDPDRNFIGRVDEVKVWNVTKGASYFEPIDGLTPPEITNVRVDGASAATTLAVDFSEGVYSSTGATGALETSDFILSDVGSNNPRTLSAIQHTAGSSTALLRMSAPMTLADLDTDTLAAAPGAIYDDFPPSTCTTDPVTITGSLCPTGVVIFNLNETTGTVTVTDEGGYMTGAVTETSSPRAMGGGYFHGNRTNNFISFDSITDCLTSSRKATLETRIRPSNITSGNVNYIRRVIDATWGGGFQLSVWRNVKSSAWSTWHSDVASAVPEPVASMAFWVRASPITTETIYFKPVLTYWPDYPIYSDHWYRVRVVWDSDVTTGIPGTIYVDDQGTNGDDADEVWSGYVDATDTTQTLSHDAVKFEVGEEIVVGQGPFNIGCATGSHNKKFDGLIDWIVWTGDVVAAPFSAESSRGMPVPDLVRHPTLSLADSSMASEFDMETFSGRDPVGGEGVTVVSAAGVSPSVSGDLSDADVGENSSQEAAYEAALLQVMGPARSTPFEPSRVPSEKFPAATVVIVGLAILLKSVLTSGKM